MSVTLTDRYRLDYPVGAGGMGIVWRATDLRSQRHVAVKEVRFPATLPEAERAELTGKVERAARLDHPHVVKVHDVVVDDGRPWIVMDLVAGRSLERLVLDDGPLSPRAAAELGLALQDALATAHGQGVVHGDVKPSNVLVAADGTARLTDFSVALALGPGTLLASPGYVAPERLRDGVADAAADHFSLGATLYFAVEGRNPFQLAGEALSGLFTAASDPHPRPAHAGALTAAIDGLLDKSPQTRLTGEAARDALREALESAVTSATSPAAAPSDQSEMSVVDTQPREEPTEDHPDAQAVADPGGEAIDETAAPADETAGQGQAAAAAAAAHDQAPADERLAGERPTGEDDPAGATRPIAGARPSSADWPVLDDDPTDETPPITGGAYASGYPRPAAGERPGDGRRKRRRAVLAGLAGAAVLALLVTVGLVTRGGEPASVTGEPAQALVTTPSPSPQPSSAPPAVTAEASPSASLSPSGRTRSTTRAASPKPPTTTGAALSFDTTSYSGRCRWGTTVTATVTIRVSGSATTTVRYQMQSDAGYAGGTVEGTARNGVYTESFTVGIGLGDRKTTEFWFEVTTPTGRESNHVTFRNSCS
ncbi:serine/threonine-protein kinase [Dactylosporangium sucinum]|uniref:non-specific serine/threonine protein kinase n=1 Tax=Dactylosporangium sucinum TaxID=1424081 RepID=A0A917U6V2_9ACTN|nr:serine/threonine-protein kinase [Dactylosporangium sucinum]GGM62959.1 hypothetical protein GCM10007977_075660 [Dactylosporangium sucinum]